MRSLPFSTRMANNVGKGLAPFRHVPFQHRISITCLRIVFGAIWAWNTLLLARHFITNTSPIYVQQVVTSSQHSAPYISWWSDFWQHVATSHPTGFILICILGMGLVACGLLFGLLTNLACGIGSLFALFFCSTRLVSLLPVGVQAGDIGVLLVFLLAFLGFIISGAGQMFGADHMLTNSLGRWAFLAAGRRSAPYRGWEFPNYEQVQWQKVEFPTDVNDIGTIQTQTIQETRSSGTREEEVVAHPRRFTTTQ